MGLSFGHGVEVSFQCIETVTPGGPVRRQPLIDLPQRLAPEPVQPSLGVGPDLDQPRLAQHPEMLRYRRLADAKAGYQVTDCLFASAQQVENAAPVGLGQNFEHAPNMTTKKYICQGIYKQKCVSAVYGMSR